MKTNHTPGPLKYDRRKNQNTGHFETVIVYGAAVLATVWPRNVEAETDANARLFAAAPELLECLERLLDTAAKHRWRANSDEVDPFKPARAAVAKARGQGSPA